MIGFISDGNLVAEFDVPVVCGFSKPFDPLRAVAGENGCTVLSPRFNSLRSFAVGLLCERFSRAAAAFAWDR